MLLFDKLSNESLHGRGRGEVGWVVTLAPIASTANRRNVNIILIIYTINVNIMLIMYTVKINHWISDVQLG